MKKALIVVLCVCVLALCACGRIAPQGTAPYADVLTAHYYWWTVFKYFDIDDLARYYAVVDIDGDGTKELLLGEADRGARTAHSWEIYTVRDHKAVRQIHLYNGSWDYGYNTPVLFQNGTIRTNDNWGSIYYYSFEDGELRKQACLENELESMSDWSETGDNAELFDVWLKQHKDWLTRCGVSDDDGASPYHLYRGEPNGGRDEIYLTQEEYERAVREFEGDGEVVEINWKPISKYIHQ